MSTVKVYEKEAEKRLNRIADELIERHPESRYLVPRLVLAANKAGYWEGYRSGWRAGVWLCVLIGLSAVYLLMWAHHLWWSP